MKEIGGYFSLEKLISKEYHLGSIGINSGRNAVAYLLRAKKIKKLYIPYFLCDSIEKVCIKEDCEYEFYHITSDFYPILDKQMKDSEYIFIVNYYGQISNDSVVYLKSKYRNIIFDNSQAFFQNPMLGIDTIYSCRKFFGVSDGAYLYTDVVIEEPIKKDVSKDRMMHLLGRYEGVASEYYEVFKQNEERFYNLELCYMSELTHNILGAIDYNAVLEKRNSNYSILKEHLDALNGRVLKVTKGPYCYPFYHTNGLEIKRSLAKREIYVPTLWPNVLQMHDSIEKDFAENYLPIPCDQRYTTEDMFYIVQEIMKCIN